MHARRLAALGLVLTTPVGAALAARSDTGPAPISIVATRRATLHATAPPPSAGPQPGENDVTFVDPEHGLLATTGGIQATDDGGLSWHTVWHRKDSQVTWVGFADRRHAFAAASGATSLLLSSGDGGATWHDLRPRLPSSHAAFFRWGNLDLQFTTSRVGFGIPFPYGPGGGTPIIRTLDGGRRWRALKTPFAPSSVRFVTTHLGYATGVPPTPGKTRCYSELFRTTDGGRTWHGLRRTCRPYDLWGIDVLDRRHIFVSGGEGYWGEVPRQTVLATTDGGRSWRTIYDHAEPPNFGGLPIVYVRFADLAHGWALTGSCKDGANGPCGGDVLVTSDGGRRWRDTGMGGARFATAGADSAWTTGGEFATVVWRTTDGARSWEPLVRPDGVNVSGLAGGGSELLAQSAAGLIAGTDEGRTWRVSSLVLSGWEFGGDVKPAVVPGLIATPTRNLGGLRLSRDGGRTWNAVYMLHKGQTVRAVAFADSRHGFVATTGGCPAYPSPSQLRVTSDGGRTWGWTRDPLGEIDELAAAPGLLVALSGVECPAVAASRDGGRTWRISTLADGAGCTSPVAIAPATVWLSCGTELLESKDAGSSWTSVRTGLDGRDLASTSSGTLWLAAASSGIWGSGDGGRTWVEHWIRLPTPD